MRPAIRKNLVARFASELERRLPTFHQMRAIKGTPPIWACQVTPTLIFFVLLQPFKRADKFALELAWSEDGEFPWEHFGSADYGAPCGRKRYPCWETRKEEVWDLAPEVTAALKDKVEAYARGEYVPYSDTDLPVEQVLLNIESIVMDSIQKLIERGLPFFRQLAAHRGIVLPDGGPLTCHEKSN